ncbi:hypothetical protein FRC17_000822 [Serendipita sp. 399]|nr:hypothetical protein FRC17_000822 [Serendipita sp. 399]
MAIHHERSAYHRYNTRVAHYQLKTFPDEPDLAWSGPDRYKDTFAWLRDRERQEHSKKKEAAWLEENKDWNKYNPDEDEFFHPEKRTLSGAYPKGKGRMASGLRGGRKGAQKAATNSKSRGARKDADDDMDTIRVIRKGIGFYTHDPVSKPEFDVATWVKGLKEASTSERLLAPNMDWRYTHSSVAPEVEETPLPLETTDELLQFGLKLAREANLDPKKSEFMHLFLEVGDELYR